MCNRILVYFILNIVELVINIMVPVLLHWKKYIWLCHGQAEHPEPLDVLELEEGMELVVMVLARREEANWVTTEECLIVKCMELEGTERIQSEEQLFEWQQVLHEAIEGMMEAGAIVVDKQARDLERLERRRLRLGLK